MYDSAIPNLLRSWQVPQSAFSYFQSLSNILYKTTGVDLNKCILFVWATLSTTTSLLPSSLFPNVCYISRFVVVNHINIFKSDQDSPCLSIFPGHLLDMTGTGPVLLLAFSSKNSTFLYLVSNLRNPEASYPLTTASIFDWFIPVQFEPKNYILVSNHAVRANFYIIKAWILLQLYWNYHNRFWIPWYRSKTQYFQTSHPTFLW